MQDDKEDEILLCYLLGEELSDADQNRIELRLFADEHFHTRLQGCEVELMRRYLRNQLTARQRELFNTRFLLSPERRQVLALMRRLSPDANALQQPYRDAADASRHSGRDSEEP